jgi:hypothetical protein
VASTPVNSESRSMFGVIGAQLSLVGFIDLSIPDLEGVVIREPAELADVIDRYSSKYSLGGFRSGRLGIKSNCRCSASQWRSHASSAFACAANS